MPLKRFEFFNFFSLQDLLEFLARHGKEARCIAGGTDLLVQMKQGQILPQRILNLLLLTELKGIEKEGGVLRIGALTRHADLERSRLLEKGWGLLALAAHKIGSPQIRHLGTIGGNLSNASPSADTAPPLLVLEAEVCLIRQKEERRMPLKAFFKGPGQTALGEDELLKEVRIPEPPEGSRFSYLKLGRRKSMDLALVSAAVLLEVDPVRKTFGQVRVALGSVAPTPIRAERAEKRLEGSPVGDETIREAAELAAQECQPITDLRASAEYRREMVKVLVTRAIQQSLGCSIPATGI